MGQDRSDNASVAGFLQERDLVLQAAGLWDT